jgi:hypothetical protein
MRTRSSVAGIKLRFQSFESPRESLVSHQRVPSGALKTLDRKGGDPPFQLVVCDL